MKRVLIDWKGCIQDIRDPGDEFEVYEGPDASVRWVTVDDDTVNRTWIMVDGKWYQDVAAPPHLGVVRKQMYGEIGDQLDRKSVV